MAIKLENKPNVAAPSATYPYGAIRDNTGSNDGTPVNTAVYGDFHQFFARMLGESGVTPNGLPDNQTNGFQYFEALRSVISSFIPPGIITMWSGQVNTIPAGWQLCDGTGGTPDLSGRFVVGYKSDRPEYNEVGKIGGDDSITLQLNQIPSHNHGAGSLQMQDHEHEIFIQNNGNQSGGIGNGWTDNNGRIFYSRGVENYNDKKWIQGTTANSGGSSSGTVGHENRPSYYVVAYIMKM